MQVLIPQFLSPENPDGAEPVPDSENLFSSFLTLGALIMDHQNGTTNVTPGTTVKFHLVNIGAFAYFHFWIECHNLIVIEVDGVDVEPYEVPGVDLAVGQRLSVLVKMDQDPTKNYPIVGSMGLTFV
jgi:iron transport multicopper oxidase